MIAHLDLYLGLFLGNWLVCPFIFGYSLWRGFWVGLIAAALAAGFHLLTEGV